jgi:dolichyl-phosphate-mannose-protein mannosyltransferase
MFNKVSGSVNRAQIWDQLIYIKNHWQILSILLLGSILRFSNLGLINGPIFDEVFYPNFALNYLTGETFFSVHPPLGSYILTLGIYLYDILPWTETINFSLTQVQDLDPLSYRWVVAVSGTALIYVGYKLALELFEHKRFGLLVALFFMLDGSLLVESRLGLINVFFSLFGFMAILFFLKGNKNKNIGHFMISGFMLGAAFSVKWNGLGFWLAILCFSFLFFIFYKLDLRFSSEYERRSLMKSLFLFISPFFIYLIIWVPELIHNENSLIEKHSQMIRYHFDASDQKAHPYSSPWYTWPLMIRPIGYFFNSQTLMGSDGKNIEIFTGIHLFPNPALSLFSFLAVIILTVKWAKSIAKSIGLKKVSEDTYVISVILTGFYANFVPWAAVSRSTFIYHYQPSACFSFMALAFLLYKLTKAKKAENMVIYYVTLILISISAIYWLPLQLGLEITSESFYSRMWFNSWI